MVDQPQITSFGIVILAAGSSRRLGKPKQLLNFRGTSLLKRAVETALAAGGAATVVVLGAQAPLMQEEIREYPVDILINEGYENGMAGSLTGGLRLIITRHPDIDGVLIMVCDQPFVSPAHLRNLVNAQRDSRKAIVSSHYENTTWGVPALFHKTLFPPLLELQGDRGARSLIEAHADGSASVPFLPGAMDIDTAEAYEALLRHSDSEVQSAGKNIVVNPKK